MVSAAANPLHPPSTQNLLTSKEMMRKQIEMVDGGHREPKKGRNMEEFVQPFFSLLPERRLASSLCHGICILFNDVTIWGCYRTRITAIFRLMNALQIPTQVCFWLPAWRHFEIQLPFPYQPNLLMPSFLN